ncbi:MAG TPA: flagellar assembly protein H, partial [Blastocatellia bacterium]|nr:flagellar assembly protein H [Blastocatellia bacterium]
MIDHDRLFKELISTFFLEFLALFLPQVRAYLQEGSLEFLDKEIFDDITSGDRHEVDLLAKLRFKGEDAFFLVHLENQAQPQANFGKRMLAYFSRLHEKYDLPVYPIALFTFDLPRKEQPGTYRVAFPDRVVLDFCYEAIQLNRLDWRDFVRRENPVASALMAKMDIAPEDRSRVKFECLR